MNSVAQCDLKPASHYAHPRALSQREPDSPVKKQEVVPFSGPGTRAGRRPAVAHRTLGRLEVITAPNTPPKAAAGEGHRAVRNPRAQGQGRHVDQPGRPGPPAQPCRS